MVDIVKGIRSLIGSGNVKGNGLPYPSWQFLGDMWVQMNDDGRNYINKAWKANSYIRAITDHIADKASDAPVTVYRIKDKKKAAAFQAITKGQWSDEVFKKAMVLKAQAFDEVENHEFANLINGKPNTYQTGKQLRRELHGYKIVTGNSYMYASTVGEKYSDGFKPVRLWCIPSPCVNIVSGDRVNPVKGYKVSYYGDDAIDPRNIAHFKELNLVTDVTGNQWLYGLSRLSSGRATIGQFEQSEKAQGTLFKNMGPLGIVSGSGESSGLDEEQAIAIQDKFENRHTGLINGGKLVVTPSDVKYTAIGISPVDLNLIEAKGDLLQEICALLYNYPKERITGSQNTASQGTADKQVITSCVLPLLRDFDDTMTFYVRQAYNDESLVVISDTQYYPELQQNMKELAEWLGKAWWIKVNEKRRAMDYDEVPDGDVMLVPSGMSLLSDVITPATDVDLNMLDENNAL
jgi:HK97 family phage portal protein